jgi:hypothetical protein
MATAEFILQGFTTRTHRAALRDLFRISELRAVLLSVAYVKESGVEEIEGDLATHASITTVFAGIRNDITSYQGLARLHRIRGLKLYTVDTGSRHVVFHPKLYLARGKTAAKIIVGSANLTLGGLNNNIEAGIVLAFEEADLRDGALISTMESELTALPAAYPSHVVQISHVRQLDEMLADGRLIDELAISPPRRKTSIRRSAITADTVTRIVLKVPPLRRTVRAARPSPKGRKRSKRAARKGPISSTPASVGVEFELMWESKPLERRDLTIPKAAGTNPTGSINLDRGLLSDGVDFRHYFRENVFANLDWKPRRATVDEAFAKFQLVLKGINYGEFDLAIHHTTSMTSKAYKQHNAMTRLSWGPTREFVARRELLGRTLAVYRDKADATRFLLEID